MSSEDADTSTIYRISLSENDSSQMSHLLNNLLVPPNVVSDTSVLPGKPSATGAPYSASNSPQSSVPGVSAEIHSTEESAGCFGGAATAQTVQVVSNFASAFSAIASAIQNS